MKAIWMTGKGGPEVLELREVAKPVPAAGEVLIRVTAAGLNRADIYTRTSASYGGNTGIPGLEVSGLIESTGAGSVGTEATGPNGFNQTVAPAASTNAASTAMTAPENDVPRPDGKSSVDAVT